MSPMTQNVSPSASQHPRLVVVDLNGPPLRANGEDARTTTLLVHFGELRVLRIWMAAGAAWPEHSTPARITVQLLKGKVVMQAEGKEHRLGLGQLCALEGAIPHAVHALEESEFLLTVAHPHPFREQ